MIYCIDKCDLLIFASTYIICYATYSIRHEICTLFSCVLFCCGYSWVHVDSHDIYIYIYIYTHILQGYFTGTSASEVTLKDMVNLHSGNHNKAQSMCIFLEKYHKLLVYDNDCASVGL